MWFFRLISRLSFPLLYRISDGLFYLVFHVFAYRRKVVKANLKGCFPNKTDREIAVLERDFYRHFCDVVVETLKLLTISPDELRSRIRHENPDFAKELFASGGSFVAMASHQANWEWLLAGNTLYLNGMVDVVYKPLHSPFFEKLMHGIRTRFGAFPLPADAVLRFQVSRRHLPKGIAMACDQTPGPDHSVVIEFLGRKTLFFKGPPKLARKLGFPLYYAGIRKEARGRYVLFVEPMEQPSEGNEQDILKDFAARLERDILGQPALWLWSHKRWKHKIPG